MNDEKFMRLCIEMAHAALDKGELPFGTVIAKGEKVMAQASNAVLGTQDPTNHSEILALREAQKQLGKDLSGCTLYTNCEPCAMCAFVIRELHISRVVFGLKSPFMGGFTRWPILQDKELETLTEYYMKPPEVVAGFMEEEARQPLLRRKKESKGFPK